MDSKLVRHYLPEIRSFITGRKKPGSVSVNITSNCNQQCVYCEIGQRIPSSSAERLRSDDLIWILDQMVAIGIRRISICGGEPFLFPELMEIISHAAQKKIQCAITTNGMTLHSLSDADLLLLKNSQAEINLSIDSFNHEINDTIRGYDNALSNALHSIARLKEYKMSFKVLTVISKYNFMQLFDIVQNAYNLGANQVLFQPVICSSNYPDRNTIKAKQSINANPDNIEMLYAEFRKILHFEARHRIKTNVYRILPWIGYYLKAASGNDGKPFFTELLPRFYCRDVHAIIDITYDGGIQPCGLAKSNISIKEQRHLGLLKLWEEATCQLRKELHNGNFPEICNACCHHFSRNMIASVMKYPYQNRKALKILAPLMFSRLLSHLSKSGLKKEK